MKKILFIGLVLAVISGCSKDPYSELRRLTYQDYLDNRPLMDEVLDKCVSDKIKDVEICDTVKKAVEHNHKFW